jgi:uncharacterized protein YjiS (DUF1127 family)
MSRERSFEITEPAAAPEYQSAADHGASLARAGGLRRETAALIAFRWMARSMQGPLAALARWHRQLQTRDALMRCSDRVLADIGIEREHIPLIAKGIDPAEYQLRDSAVRRWWTAARARVDAARTARRERRRVFRELDAYSDRELEEIGLRRADIALIARGRPILRRAA